MAGDWIKVEMATPDKPEVVRMAARLKIDQDAVIGKLLRVWIWADINSVDGSEVGVTEAFIDRLTSKKGFALAMRAEAWLAGADGALSFPGFGRHNGRTAKARAMDNRKKADQRERDRNGTSVPDVVTSHVPVIVPMSTGQSTGQTPGPEKRREENTPQSPQTGGGEKDDFRPRLTLPASLAASPAFVAFWWEKWFTYLLERKGGRNPTISTLEAHLQACAKMGPVRAIAGMKSAIEKEWAAPDENAKVTNTAGGGRPWDDAPDDWKAWWRDTYPPEDFPDAPRYENGEWSEVTADHKKHIWEGLQKQHRRSA